jgi:hypothetical protein
VQGKMERVSSIPENTLITTLMAAVLEAIHLKYPVRRYLDDDGSKKYYEIPSRYLVIPNNDIININLKYINSVEIDASEITEDDELIQED